LAAPLGEAAPWPAALDSPPQGDSDSTGPAKRAGGVGLIVALVTAGVLLVGGLGFGVWWFSQRDASPADTLAAPDRATTSGWDTEGQAEPEPNSPASQAPASPDVPDEPGAPPLSKCTTPPMVSVESASSLTATNTFSLGLRATCDSGDILDHSAYRVAVSDVHGPLAVGTIFIGEQPLALDPTGLQFEVVFETIYSTVAEHYNLNVTLDPLGAPMTYDPALVGATSGFATFPASESDLSAEELTAVAMAALERQAAYDFPLVAAQLEDHWVPQISSKHVGMAAAGIIWGPKEIWDQFLAFRDRYPNVVLTDSDQWNCYRPGQRYWVISIPTASNDAAGALSWCTSQGMGRDECYAKRIGNTGFEGATAFND